MASLASVMVKVGADISEFTREMSKVDSDLGKAGKTFSSAGKNMTSAGKTIGKAVTLPLMGLGAMAVMTGAKFDEQMSKVQAISGATGGEMQALRDSAKELGSTTRWSASEAGAGMEFLARAGWDTTEIISAMPNVLDLATAGAIDLGAASDIASNIISGFGATASESGRYIDVMSKTTATANTDVNQLGDAMKYVAPVASAMGWSVEDTASAIGKMSDAGIQGSQAGTALRGGLLRLANPSKEASKLMSQLSLDVFDAEGNLKSMPDVIGSVADATKGMTSEQKAQTLATLFGQEAVSGFMALLEVGEDGLRDYSTELENSQGHASETAKTMGDNLMGAFKNLGSAIEGLAISFGEILTPAVRTITEWITGLVRKFDGLSDKAKMVIVIVALVASAMAPLLIVTGLLAQGIGALITVFGMVSAPVLAIIAGIALFVAALAIAYAKIEPFREIVNRVFTQAKELILQAMEAIATFLREKLTQIKQFWDENGQQILQAVKNVWNKISPIIDIALKLALAVVKYVWNAIKGVIDGALNIIMGLIKIFAGLFTGDFSKMWEGVKQLFKGAIQFVWNLMNLSFVGAIKKLVVNLAKNSVKSLKGMWDSIKLAFMYGKDKAVSLVTSLGKLALNLFKSMGKGILNAVKSLWNGVKSVFNTMKSVLGSIFNAIKSVAVSVWNAIKSGITGIVNAIKSVITSVWNAIKSVITSVLNGIKSVATSIWNGIKSTITSVINGIKSTVSSVFNGIKSTISSIFNGIKSTATTVWNGIKTAITKPIQTAKKTVLGIIDTIKGAFSKMKIKIPKPKLPKISVNMKKGVMGIPYPDFNVNWNAKGGIYNGASILGGGQGVGEAGAEAVLPIQHKRYMKPFAGAIADHLPQESDREVVVNNNTTTVIELDGEVVGRKVEKTVSRKQLDRQNRTNRGGRR